MITKKTLQILVAAAIGGVTGYFIVNDSRAPVAPAAQIHTGSSDIYADGAYDLAYSNQHYVDACNRATFLAEKYMRANDNLGYERWKRTQKHACALKALGD